MGGRKRRRHTVVYDAYCDMQNTGGKLSGRGIEAGYVRCSLCPPSSQKRFAKGRGLSMHLNVVHAPSTFASREEEEQWKSLAAEAVRNAPEVILRRNEKVVDGSVAGQPHSSKVSDLLLSQSARTDDQQTRSQHAQPAWLIAAKEGNLLMLQSLMESGCNLYAPGLKDKHGATAEHWAAGSGHLHCLQFILWQKYTELLREQKGSKTEEILDRTSCRETHSEKDRRVELKLTQLGASPTISAEGLRPAAAVSIPRRRRDGRTSLHWAARNGHLSCLMWLLGGDGEQETDIRNGFSAEGGAGKHREQSISDSECVREKKDDVCVGLKTDIGTTGLEEKEAADPQLSHCVEANTVVPSGQVSNGRTLGEAAQNRDLATRRIPNPGDHTESQADVQPVGPPADWVLPRILRFNVDVGTYDGTTPLHYACFGGHLTIVKALLSHGADLHKSNNWDCDVSHWTAMSPAGTEKSIQICRFLRKEFKFPFHRAQVNGHTPIHKAAEKGNLELVKWLLREGGLSPREKELAGTKDEKGRMPSDIAFAAGHEKLAGLLIAEGW